MLKTFGKYLLGAFLSLMGSILVVHGVLVVYVHIYAFRLGVPLATLSNDYGLAFEIVFVAFITFCVGMTLGIWLTYWVISLRNRREKI